MSNAATERMMRTARQIVAIHAQATAELAELAWVIAPMCGKPGRGFKAAKRNRPRYDMAVNAHNAAHAMMARFITPSTKLSIAERDKRRAYITAALAERHNAADTAVDP